MAPIVRGGLNIVDFETRCSSLHLSGLSGLSQYRTTSEGSPLPCGEEILN